MKRTLLSKYSDLAIRAVGLMLWEPGTPPRTAWRRAGEQVFPDSPSAREKGCPMSTFLGLCEEGLVPGAPAGSYTQSVLNKEYALRALQALRSNPKLFDDDAKLWAIANGGTEISSNHQLEVLRSLWAEGLVR